MGQWIKEIFPHTHDYPAAAFAAQTHKIGSIWECNCGKRFELQNEQRDGWYWREKMPPIPTRGRGSFDER